MGRSSCGCGYGNRKPLAATTFNQAWKLFGEAPEWKPRRLAFGKDVAVAARGR
jgi:hypothetical protein